MLYADQVAPHTVPLITPVLFLTRLIMSDMGSMEALMGSFMGGKAAGGDHHDRGGIWALLAILLLDRRGGLGGSGGDCASTQILQAINASQNDITTAIGNSRDAIAASSTATQFGFSNTKDAITTSATATQFGFSNLKDAVQANSVANLTGFNSVDKELCALGCGLGSKIDNTKFDLAQAINASYNNLTLQNTNLLSTVNTGVCAINHNIERGLSATLSAINCDGEKTRALINANTQQDLRDRLALAQTALLEEKENHRSTKTSINIGSTVSTGIGTTASSINDSIVNSFNALVARQDVFFGNVTNVLANFNASIQRMESTNGAASVNVNTANTGTLGVALSDLTSEVRALSKKLASA